jgi:Zn finger protein HypA/HybF involved in hydrogenase expression
MACKIPCWCLHCEKAINTPAKEFFGGEVWYKCPFCGAGHYDLWNWEEIRERHPEYPELPEDGGLYPLY